MANIAKSLYMRVISRHTRTQTSNYGNTCAFVTANFNLFIVSIAVLENANVPPDQGLQKRANFSTLIVGLAGTGDQNRATCVAGSGANRSAIHYDYIVKNLPTFL
jgi:hypothetical protein